MVYLNIGNIQNSEGNLKIFLRIFSLTEKPRGRIVMDDKVCKLLQKQKIIGNEETWNGKKQD